MSTSRSSFTAFISSPTKTTTPATRRTPVTEATVTPLPVGQYAVLAIENNKVVPNSLAWALDRHEAVLWTKHLQDKHPHAVISVEAKGGRVARVLKPGDRFEGDGLKESNEIFKKDTRVKVPHKGKMTRGKIVRYDDDKAHAPHGWPFYVVDVGEYESLKVPIHKVVKEATEVVTEAFTKQHFIALANVIKQTAKDYDDSQEALAAITRITGQLAILFKRDNPNFDAARFIRACEIP